MKGMKRILAMLLAVVMVVGLIPATVFAANDNVDYLFIATDRHANTSIIATMINAMESKIGENELDYLALGGDMDGSGNSHDAYNSSTVLAEITGATSSLSAANVDIVAGIHDVNCTDGAGILLPYGNGGAQIYEGKKFYVYGVPESCISGGDSQYGTDDPETEANAFVTWANNVADKTKAIIVVSHYPLHVRRKDNKGATYWHEALNKVAAGNDTTIDRNVAFFWGHNHTSESSTDTAVYHVEPNGSITVEDGSNDTSTKHTIYYTYANAGYLNSHSSATLITITDDTITFDKYKNSSVSTSYSVDRVAEAAPTLSSIAISGTTSYYVGDKLALTVTATYSDGTTKDVTADSTLSGYDMSTAGTQTVTATYEGKTATIDITVSKAAAAESIDVTGTTRYTVGESLSLTVTVTYDNGNTSDVTAEATFSGCDLTASGVYTVTATYGELTDTIDVTVAVYDEDDAAVIGVEAVSQGATELTVTWDDAAETVLTNANVYCDFVVYDLALTGHTAGNAVEYSMFVVDGMDTTNLVVYHVAEDGTLTEVEYKLENECVVFTTDLTGTFAYGAVTVPVGYTLDSLKVTHVDNLAYVDYFVGESPYTGDYVVTAVYTKEGAEDFTRVLLAFEANNNPDGYEVDLTSIDMTAAGRYNLTFTYGGKTGSFPIRVWGHDFTASDVTVHVDGEEYGVTNVTVAESKNANVSTAIQYVIEGDNYVAYDISLTYSEGYKATEDVKTVTLPVPANVTDPVVYYVPESGSASQMNATVSEDGTTVTFTTTHFSTYVVGNSLTLTGTDTDATVPGYSDTTTTYDVVEKTVYKKVTTPVSGKTYLIVNSANGTGYGLDGDTTGYATNAFTGGSDYYSTWDSTTNTGSAFAAGSDVYLTTTDGEAYLWTAGSDSFAIGYTQSSDGSFFNGYTYSYTLNPSGSGGDWTLNESNLTVNLQTASGGLFGGSSTYADYYLTNSGSTWGMATGSGSNVYFYEPVTVYYVTTGTEGSTTQEATYGMYITYPDSTGTYVDTQQAITAQEVTQGETLQLGAVFTSTVEGQNPPSTGSWYITSSNTGIATVDQSTGLVTFTGLAGSTLIQATYTWEENGATYSVSNYVTIATTAVPDEKYSIDLTDGAPDFNSITAPITIKGVTEGQTTSVWAVVKAGDVELGTLGGALRWKVSDATIASIDTATGVITFTGEEGTVDVTVYYTCPGGKVIEDTVTFSVTVGNYTVPEDGTKDFPEYPEEGAIRFDKHATAVGNFSETGIAQVELSMTGVPYSTGSEIDVVVMLDMTGSMSDNGMEAAEEATKAFVAKIVKNEDDTYNNNRVAVYAFNSGGQNNSSGYSIYTLVELTAISSDTELETANTAIDTASDKQQSGGTPYTYATKQCYDVLAAAKTDGTGNNRQQFCVFMSDGGPTEYYATDSSVTAGYREINNDSSSGTSALVTYMENYTSTDSSTWKMTLPSEYYTDQMKANGVTVYTVGLLVQEVSSNASPWKSMNSVASVYNSTTDSLTTIGTHYFFTSSILKKMASDESKYIDIFTVSNAANATKKFESIAMSIREAATDVSVTDKITEDYTMVFEAPNATVAGALPAGQEIYIEVKDYVLNPVYTVADIDAFQAGVTYYTKGTDGTYTKVTGSYSSSTTYYTITDYTRGTATSLVKLYLGKSGTTYYAASDANGTAYAAPTFNQTAIGTKYYWTTTADTASGVSVTVDGTTYYFVAAGISNEDDDYVAANWYNMASGAYAFGNIVTTDILDTEGKDVGDNSTCDDLIIATPHFVYNAKTKMLVWTAEKLSTTELTLTYFLYLDESGGYSGAQGETNPGTYETNEYAYLNYTNFQGTECQQTMPVPQMTWNGAQVSYVFYLVNAAGQPVNRAGKVVPFSEAVYVTDVHTYSIVWNDMEQVASLEAAYLAEELVPDIYDLYDSDASYNIHVFEDENEQNLNNHFVIKSALTNYTTYVFNSKVDATKYKAPGAYAASASYKCKEYVEGGEFTDDEGAYNIVTKNDAIAVYTGFDFSNTTVAFAVVWKPQLVEDVVVVDFGLDVVVNVIENDALAAGVVGVRADAPDVAINSGTYDAAKATSVDLYIDANSDADGLKELKIGTATVANLTSVRFSLDATNGMQFNKPAKFYYEADVNYYDNGELQSESMYSSVTVIPATTVYYEDSFVTFSASNTEWVVEGTTANKTQAVDRPGESKLSDTHDADNIYGYDAAYDNCSTYSLGSAHKVHVDANSYGTATFSFYGTGFDVIGMTSNDTGVLAVKVVNDVTGEKVTKIVDTYYGYTYGSVKKVYTYTLLEATTDAEGNAVPATYTWVLTSTEAGSGTSTDMPTEPKVGDTYTVYENDWYPVDAAEDTDNNLYQVPVIKVEDLPYAKYTVTITATYMKAFDHTTEDGYDLYLDAIRIYDPVKPSTAVGDKTIEDIYKADNEGWPDYMELRDMLLTANDFEASLDSTVLTGAMFIDGISSLGDAKIADYTSYGPNNEVYLAPGQGVAFALSSASYVHVGMRRMTGTATYTIESYDEDGNLLKSMTGDVTSATDMYYDITDLKDGTIVIRNSGESGELMITNLKYTFESNPAVAQVAMFMTMRRSAMVLSALNTIEDDSAENDDSNAGDNEVEDNTADNDNTNNDGTTDAEQNDTVSGETTAPESNGTVNDTPETDKPAEENPEEELPKEEAPEATPEEEIPEDSLTTGTVTEQLGFWARLWNAIKNAFNRLFTSLGF